MLRSVFLILPLSLVLLQTPNERFHQPIRNNDLAQLRALIKQHGAGTTDARRQTPLMLASAFGSIEAMQMLIDAGADVKAVSASGLTALHLGVGDIRKVKLLADRGADIHARSQMGRTPLLVAAHTNGATETVKYLLAKGADLKVADAAAITPLFAAVSVDDAATARLLIESGSDINARATIPSAATPLMVAVHNGNAEVARLLLAKNAAVNVASESANAKVLNGSIQFGAVTALHTASLTGSPEIVRMLLDAGARIDAQDIRGMTPLMWSVSTDRANPAIIKMLLAKGSDASTRSKAGESTHDWARKFNHPAVMAELGMKPAAIAVATQPAKNTSARTAVERSMPLLQNMSSGMRAKGGCVACHAQPVTHVAAMLAHKRGWDVGNSFLPESLETINRYWMNADQPLLQANESGGTPETLLYSTTALAAAGVAPSWNTDVLVHYLISKQRAAGNWKGIGASRAPIQDGDFSRTAMSIRTLAVYGIPARRTEIDERIKRAADWLAAQTPLTNEDRVMQLLGLHWANANARLRETRTRDLIGQQRSDGGWAQTPHLQSDAYATGQALYTLRELGIPATDAALRRGIEYLLRTQRDDGSWFVASRAMKIQPYFESGFPYGHDQWISSAATAWAAMGLSVAAPESAGAGVPRVR